MFANEHLNVKAVFEAANNVVSPRKQANRREVKLNTDSNIAEFPSDAPELVEISSIQTCRLAPKIYKRDFVKKDGRMLYLYGYSPHKSQAEPQSDGPISKGGELRWHPLRQEWNIYAPHRQNRTFKPSAADDPLAPTLPGGPETEIPFSDFEMAVFENKFTSLHAEAPRPPALDGVELGQAKGHCDVIVYGPESQGNLHSIGQKKRRLLLAAWIDRYRAHYSAGHKFVLPFENRGDEVGVTLHHPHGQIYAFPFIPQVQKKAAEAFDNGYDLSDAISNFGGDYIVSESKDIVAFCPPFARFPFECWIAPRQRHPGPWTFSEGELDGFATLLGEMTLRYDKMFGRPTAYMMTLHAAPAGYDETFHFTTQFYPLLRAADRVKYLASVEQSTGVFTVDVMPEFAAEKLRAAI